MNYPNVVKKLVCIGNPYNISNYYDGVLNKFQNISADIETFKTFQQLLTLAKEMYEKVAPDPDHLSVFIEKLVKDMYTRAPDYTLDQLAKIKCPTLLIMGANEQFFPVECAKEMVEAIPNAELTVIPDATHFVPLEKPKEINNVILNFLKR